MPAALRLFGRLLRGGDRAAGGLARLATTLGQVALVCLGAHLAADRLDDRVYGQLSDAQAWLDARLAPALGPLGERLGLGYERLLLWERLPLAPAAAWVALLLELLACALLCASFLLTPRRVELSWMGFRRALSVHALVLPVALAGTLLAGAWSLAMAAEDLLPPSPVAPWAGGALALAVLVRFGMPAWGRAVGALERSGRPARDLLVAVLIGPIGLLAWLHGVPCWAWLP